MLSVATPGALLAQQTEREGQEDETFEEIEVTGSRIARDPNLAGAIAVQSVDAEEIQLSGEFSISDVMNDIPALLGSTTHEQSINQEAPANALGFNVLNLRNLGANRTLVLVDGRRHVGGVGGSSAVDIGSIPAELIERVEVLTGGASAVYGADAVSGVVNFIIKDDFEGLVIDGRFGSSSESDSQQASLTATWGMNFAQGRGNVAVSVDHREDDGLLTSERSNGFLIGSARAGANPDLNFQQGEISSATTPNIAQLFTPLAPGGINYGQAIPSEADFVAQYTTAFGSAPNLTDAEQALFTRAANAPTRAILPGTSFPFTSAFGVVSFGNPLGPRDALASPDTDNDGVPDCLQSLVGTLSTFISFGGCWNIRADGQVLPFEDGVIGSNFNQYGGDSLTNFFDEQNHILLPEDKTSINLLGHFDLSDSVTVFGEVKYVDQETFRHFRTNSFWDNAPGLPDNPFIPDFLVPAATASGQIAISLDPKHFEKVGVSTRETVRGVVGLKGELDEGWNYEASVNYGRFEREVREERHMIADRFFAATDVVLDPATGQPVCRVDIDPNATPQDSITNFPAYDPGYYSFTPGAGQCVPLNIWAGAGGVTQEAIDFVTGDRIENTVLDQTVFTAVLTGNSERWFELPAGAVDFAVGVEYREEESRTEFDSLWLGDLPPESPFAGQNVADISDNVSLFHRPATLVQNSGGDYDVSEIFVEAALPLVAGESWVEELSVTLAGRFSDYSTIGDTFTWTSNLLYAPTESLAFRGTYSESVRAPNISELFAPETGIVLTILDPCDAVQIQGLASDNPTLAQQVQDNCVADLNTIGLDPFDPVTGEYNFVDTTTGAFPAVSGGNPSLLEETSTSYTAGFVFQPGFLEGLSVTVDYWDISIEDAVANVSGQNIADGCYQGPTPNDAFCSLFTRNPDSSDFQFGTFNFMRLTLVNFARTETSGIDFSVRYQFDIGRHGFAASVQGTDVRKIDEFQNPLDSTQINMRLGELQAPELAGNVRLNWSFGGLSVGWQSLYVGEQLLRDAEIETAESLYGRSVFMDETWVHDLNARYLFGDSWEIYGAINNITDEKPFVTERAYPASARGTFYFVGLRWQL